MNDIRIVVPDSAATLFRLPRTPGRVVEYVSRAIVHKYDKANERDDTAPLPPPPDDAALPWAIVEEDVDRQIEYAIEGKRRMAEGGKKGNPYAAAPKVAKAPQSTSKHPEAPLTTFDHPEGGQSIRSGKVRSDKVRSGQISSDNPTEDLPTRAHARPSSSIGELSDSTFFDPSIDPVDLAVALVGKDAPADRRAYGAILKSIGAKEFRDILDTYWHEIKAGEVPDNLVAALLVRLRQAEKARKEDR